MTESAFDFIVVGSGPSGASLASRLSRTLKNASVLLIEAGEANEDPKLHSAGDRNTFWATSGRKLDRGYITAPQEALNDRELPYHRGIGLGGSSAINIGVYDYGCKPDMDEWARQVGDDWWSWVNVETRFRQLEAFHDLTPKDYERYVQPDTELRGRSGPIDITYPAIWDPCLPQIFKAVEEHKLPLSQNISSGDGLGIGVAPATVIGTTRVTAASAYLKTRPANLYIETNRQVQKVTFEGKRARAVELDGGEQRLAAKEIILCAGVIDTPKTLLLSGVGGRETMVEHGITVVLDQPNIGLELKDHPMIRLGAAIDSAAFTEKPLPAGTEDIAAAAQGYLKLNSASIPAFETLPERVQSHLQNESQPTHELLLRVVPSPAPTGGLIWVAVLVLMNCQSLGKVTIRSDNPCDPPIIDLKLLSHPYDMQLATEVVRSTVPLVRESRIIPTKSLALGPQSLADEDIESFVRSTATHLWHGCGTVRMGKGDGDGACVTSDFKLKGLDGIRVADMSVAPVIPSHHTQSTAYLIGERAAEILIQEYNSLM